MGATRGPRINKGGETPPPPSGMQVNLLDLLLSWLPERWRRPVAIAIALLVALAAIGGFLRSSYFGTVPEVHVVGSDATQPFALPFSITNPSDYLDLRQVKWSCRVEDTRIGGIRLSNIGLISSAPFDLSRKAVEMARCPLASIGDPKVAMTMRAKITTRVDYSTLWFARTPVETEFNWISGRWVEGRLH